MYGLTDSLLQGCTDFTPTPEAPVPFLSSDFDSALPLSYEMPLDINGTGDSPNLVEARNLCYHHMDHVLSSLMDNEFVSNQLGKNQVPIRSEVSSPPLDVESPECTLPVSTSSLAAHLDFQPTNRKEIRTPGFHNDHVNHHDISCYDENEHSSDPMLVTTLSLQGISSPTSPVFPPDSRHSIPTKMATNQDARRNETGNRASEAMQANGPSDSLDPAHEASTNTEMPQQSTEEVLSNFWTFQEAQEFYRKKLNNPRAKSSRLPLRHYLGVSSEDYLKIRVSINHKNAYAALHKGNSQDGAF